MVHLANDGAGAALFLSLFLVGGSLYFLPTICALIRKVPNRGSVIVVNVFLGWTFIGWVVALAMAFRSQSPSVNVNIQNAQPWPWPQQRSGGWQQQEPGQPPVAPPRGQP